MKISVVELSELVSELESGSRPKGGVKESNEGIPSLGAEHLDDLGGFKLKKLKTISESFFQSMKKGVIQQHD